MTRKGNKMANIEELTQSDIDKMETALERYKKENEKFRTQRDEYKAAAESGEANAKLRERTLQAEAKLKLSSLGVKDTDRFGKYIDYSKVTLNDEGEIAGLDEQIESIKGDFPEVFDSKRRVGGKVDAAADNPANMPKTTTDLQLDALFGK